MTSLRRWAAFSISVAGLFAIAPTQPLDTTSGPDLSPVEKFMPPQVPARDSLQRNTADSNTVIIEHEEETARPVIISGEYQGPAKQVSPARAEAGIDRIFSLFDFAKTVAVGPSLSYFYYNEQVDIDPLIKEFRNLHTYQPAIQGKPKQTEYGAVIGFNLGVARIARVMRKPCLFLRPHFGLLVGLANTYDGSSPADTTMAAGTITFQPVKEQKNNLFFSGGLDLGWVFRDMKYPWTVYSGLDIKIWYRDMTFYSQQSSMESSSETYYWFSVPLGTVITRPLSPRVVIGCEPRIDFMFYGRMQASETSSMGTSLNYPVLWLGNRASYRLDAFLQKRSSGSVSLRFGPYAMLYGFGASNTDYVIKPATYGSASGREAFMKPASASFLIGLNLQMVFLRQSLEQKGNR